MDGELWSRWRGCGAMAWSVDKSLCTMQDKLRVSNRESRMDPKLNGKTVCIAGLGYVGLPLALAFSEHLKTIGFDVDAGKIRELSGANDNQNIAFTDDPEEIGSADFIIIAVPTPVTKSKDPDLSYIESAARTIGRNLKRGAIVVLESTVYPGATAAPSVMCNG